MPKRLLLSFFVLLFVFMLLGCQKPMTAEQEKPQKPEFKIEFTTEYQVVILDNGNAYFGKLEFPGEPFILLKDVYYIQTQINQETKAQANILIKRGKELHGPDVMYINTQHVAIIEPVGPDSKVAKLIKEEKAKPIEEEKAKPEGSN